MFNKSQGPLQDLRVIYTGSLLKTLSFIKYNGPQILASSLEFCLYRF